MTMIGPRMSASASLTPRTSSGGIRLVKKLPGPMMTASNAANRLGDGGMNRHVGLEPHALDLVAARLPRVHFHLAARLRAVAVLRAD